MMQLLLFVFFFVVSPVWADLYSRPVVVDASNCEGNVTAPEGTICQESNTGLSYKCQNPDSGGSVASYCEPTDTDAWVALVSIANLESQSSSNLITVGEMQLGVAFPTGTREIYNANSEANAFIVGVDTNADNSSDLGVRIFCDSSAGECYTKMFPDGPTNFTLADTESFNIYDATTPTANLLFSVPEDGSAIVGIESFKTIDVSSGTAPVADGSRDTITLTGTAPVTVTGDSETDAITIAITQRESYFFSMDDLAGTADTCFLGAAANAGGCIGNDSGFGNLSVYPVARNGMLTRMCCIASNVVAGTTNLITVRLDSADQTGLQIADITTAWQCDTGAVAATAGQRLSVSAVESGTGGDGGRFLCVVDLEY